MTSLVSKVPQGLMASCPVVLYQYPQDQFSMATLFCGYIV